MYGPENQTLFQNQYAIKIPVVFVSFANSSKSSIVLTASNVYLPLIKPFWVWWVSSGRIGSSLLGNTLDAIFNVYVDQWHRSPVLSKSSSLSFFSDRVIIACFCELDSCPCWWEKFRDFFLEILCNHIPECQVKFHSQTATSGCFVFWKFLQWFVQFGFSNLFI